MKWNKSEYGNIEDIRMPPSKLWKPDVLMYNRWVARAWVVMHDCLKASYCIDS
jgi:hypothetical protein